MKDALGNEVKMDKVYGHSARTSGFVTVVVGRVIEIDEEKGVTLSIINRGQASYTNDVKKTKVARSVVTILGNSLFPVNDRLNWLDMDDK